MKNFRSIYLLAFTCQFLCLSSLAENNNDGNPLLANRWQRVTESNGCVVEITFSPNGRFTIVSAENFTEGTYSISEKLPSNFYKVTRKITKDSGGFDCLGNSKDYTGQEFTYFVKLTPSGDHLGCTSENLVTCDAQYRIFNQSNADRKESLSECSDEQYSKLNSNLLRETLRKIKYPKVALRNGWEGVAEINELINLAEGKLILAEVSKSSGYQILDNSLIEAISLVQIPQVKCQSKNRDFVFVKFPVTFKINKNDISLM